MKMNNHTKAAIKKTFSACSLYQAPYAYLKKCETEYRRTFSLSPEESFALVSQHLELVRNSDDSQLLVESLWDDIFNALLDSTTIDNESVVQHWTAIILSIITICLLQVTPRYNILAQTIINHLVTHVGSAETSTLHKFILAAISKYDDNRFKAFVVDFMASNRSLCAEIKEVTTEDDVADLQAGSINQTGKYPQFSNAQLVLLCAYLLDESLSPEFTKVSKFAEFIGLVSGKSPDSIRQTIMAIQKSGKFNKLDARRVASYLENFSPEKAQDILNDIVDTID